MKIEMQMEKAIVTTIRFAEVLKSKLDTPSIGVNGVLYVPKATLKAIGWKEGKSLEIEITVK